uniref:Uncharacterized protein n=1 Tax=Fagus sylvatica TaxID=28930 RepID=A0A2N9EKL8_FAGSY
MVSEGGSWSSVRSEDLPEGLSDRDEGSRSIEDTSSISGSSKAVGPEDSWTARSYLSKVVDSDELDRYRRKYQIPEDVVLRIPESDEVAYSSRYGDVAFYEADFNAGIRFPLQPLMRELLDHLNLSPGQLAPNAWRTVVGSMVMWKVLSNGKDDLTLDELLFCYKPSQILASPGFWTLNMRQRGLKLIVGNPSSNREWKDNYVFVCGDNWEGLQCEKDDNFIPVHRESLKRPKLNSDGHNRVLRALHHKEHHFKHFIRPELFALDGNCEAQQGEVEKNDEPARRGSVDDRKKRKAETSSKKTTDERSLPPPPPPTPKPPVSEPVPTSSVEVVEIPAQPSSSRFVEKPPTLPRDASLACRRAKSAVTKDDIAEYDKVNTDVIKVAGVHSLMKGLTELTVIANRCTQWEEALLKQKCQLSEAAQANQRDEDLKRALDDVKRADEQVKKLTSQLEVARVSAVEDFKSSEAYDDNNTKYFLSGFSFLKKQAKEKYPELDFEAFQPFDDDESVMPIGDDNAGPSTDPQMDDDATS